MQAEQTGTEGLWVIIWGSQSRMLERPWTEVTPGSSHSSLHMRVSLMTVGAVADNIGSIQTQVLPDSAASWSMPRLYTDSILSAKMVPC